jgi:hypothetical protein
MHRSTILVFAGQLESVSPAVKMYVFFAGGQPFLVFQETSNNVFFNQEKKNAGR